MVAWGAMHVVGLDESQSFSIESMLTECCDVKRFGGGGGGGGG